MAILVTGSMAYDYVMDFPDSFKNHILPDQIHMLSVAFLIEELHKNYGGCAANMAHTMRLLGADPIVLSPLGKDGSEYIEDLQRRGINTTYIRLSAKKLTASAHITTDKEDNQITAFHPGALTETETLSVHDVSEPIDLAIIGPTDPRGMKRHAKECHEKQIPMVCDPGQMITALSAQDMMRMIGQATFLIANDYEMKLIEDKTGWPGAALLDHVEVMITTLGERGSIISTKDEIIEIAPGSPQSVEDPTGAGDAYRAGFFTAYTRGQNLTVCGRVGSVAAAYAIEHYGTQNHTFTINEFRQRYEHTYGEALDLNGTH